MFLEFGVNPRVDARCPNCAALERHRLLILFLRKETDFFDGRPKRFLHVAPEKAFIPTFSEAIGGGYLTADLLANGVMAKMDVTDIGHPDETFDVIYCSHVLEHVGDDRKAMSEFWRVLKKDGWAILNVPMGKNPTVEDPTVTDPAERLRRFGQKDHVRVYGPDYVDRLAEAGFRVERFSARDVLAESELERHGLARGRGGEVFLCTK
jgi:SAM-dependent methyltransferase